MGLSTKLVASDHDWSQTLLQPTNTEEAQKPSPARRQPPEQRQQQQQASEPLKCPRCGSANTKFCYYNNYNKSQPRHFCKACKRHWTKGGTLRNVPVGGGRKNKRLKTVSPIAAAASVSTGRRNAPIYIQSHRRDQQNRDSQIADQATNAVSGVFYPGLLRPQSSPGDVALAASGFGIRSFPDDNGCSFIGTADQASIHDQLPCNFEAKPSSISTPRSFQSSDVYNYSENNKMETLAVESTISTILPTTSCGVLSQQPWQSTPPTSGVMELMPSYWNWNDIDPLNTVDQSIPWYDMEINP